MTPSGGAAAAGQSAASCWDVRTGTLFVLAVLFWMIGCAICLGVGVSTVLGKGGSPPTPAWGWRWLVLSGGGVAGVLQAYVYIWPYVAESEVKRIRQLPRPRAYDFFPARRLLFMVIAVPCIVQVQLRTAQYTVSQMIFVGLLTNVGVFLLLGAIRIFLGWMHADYAEGGAQYVRV